MTVHDVQCATYLSQKRCGTDENGKPVAVDCYAARLQKDLERLLRYASTEKSIELTDDIFKMSATSIQKLRAYCERGEALSIEDEENILRTIDTLSRKAHPVTAASLEVSEIMGTPHEYLDDRQAAIKNNVESIISYSWFLAIIVVFFAVAAASWDHLQITQTNHTYRITSINILAGILGACAYVLRSILTKLGEKTFIPKDKWAYILRFTLGAILGYIIPTATGLVEAPPDKEGTLAIPPEIVAFLAGYAVEPMFSALDNLVDKIKVLVGRSPAGGAVTAK